MAFFEGIIFQIHWPKCFGQQTVAIQEKRCFIMDSYEYLLSHSTGKIYVTFEYQIKVGL